MHRALSPPSSQVSQMAYPFDWRPTHTAAHSERMHLRSPEPVDAYAATLLLNSTQEPHFHTTAARLRTSWDRHPTRTLVVGEPGQPRGLLTLWAPEFHPTHLWIGLHLHPDHRADDTTPTLLHAARDAARAQGRTHLWLSVREDYLSTAPDLTTRGLREVHRTFGGGLHLRDWTDPTPNLRQELEARGYHFTPAQPHADDPRLHDLYARTRDHKVTAAPTIPEASPTLTGEDVLWDAAHLAWQGEELIGISLPETSRLDAWNAVLTVTPEHRRQGVGRALLALTARALREQGFTFLNAAGSARDMAYLRVLRQVGANIEPDWIAWETPC